MSGKDSSTDDFTWVDPDVPLGMRSGATTPDDSLEDAHIELKEAVIDVPFGIDARLIYEIRNTQKAEIEFLENALQVIAVQGVDRKKTEALHELTAGHFSSTASLYLHRLALNQKHHGAKYLQPISIDDLIDLGEVHTISEIKSGQNEKTEDILISLDFEEELVRDWFQSGGESLQAKLRLVGWLTNQPFMKSFNAKVRKENSANDSSILPQVLFASALEKVSWECLRHFQNKDVDYDLRLRAEREAFTLRSKALMGVAHLSKHLLGDEEFGTPRTR